MAYASASGSLRARRAGLVLKGSGRIGKEGTTGQRLQAIAHRRFHALGIWLSTHQISALLLCSLVICSLLCPALLLYFSPSGALSLQTLSISPLARAKTEMPWDMEPLRRQGLITSKEPVCWDRLSAYYASRELPARVVRVEQVLISTSEARRHRGSGALGKSTLVRAARIQRELERRLLEGEIQGLSCVLAPRNQDGSHRCAVVSPVGWWRSEADLLDDQDVHKTLALYMETGRTSLNRSRESFDVTPAVPITPGNSLIGVGRDSQGQIRGARRLALTFFLEETYSAHHPPATTLGLVGSQAELAANEKARISWRNAVKSVVSGRDWPEMLGTGDMKRRVKLGEMDEMRGLPKRVILKFLPWLSVTPNPRLLEGVIFSIGYIVVGLYVYRAIRSLAQVNSKAGLLLTGFVELTSSGVISISICWLLGWGIALIPWNLLIFLIVACGVDNMLLLAHAVVATDLDMPVPERVASALTAYGPTATITLCGELVLAGTLDLMVGVPIIRQILCFISVILVVNFFLEMTFFATILSIDAQRLELADLLGQEKYRHTGPPPTTISDVSAEESKGSQIVARSRAFVLKKATRSYFHQRATRAFTFCVLAGFDTVLVILYGSDHFLPAFCSETALSPQRPLLAPSLSAEVSRSLLRGQRDRSRGSNAIAAGAGESFWHVLNPFNASSVHLYVEPPVAVQLYDDGLAAPESLPGHSISEPSVFGKVAVIVVPIIVTTALLYLLLLYLLKDVDLLEGDRSSSSDPARRRSRSKKANAARWRTVRIKHGDVADVELVTSSADAVATWCALGTQVSVWRFPSDKSSTAPTILRLPISADLPTLTFLALDAPIAGKAQFCAAVTNEGSVHIWSLEHKLPIHFKSFTDLTSGSPNGGFTTIEQLGRVLSFMTLTLAHNHSGFVSMHDGGALAVWNPSDCQVAVVTRSGNSRHASSFDDSSTSIGSARHMLLRDADRVVLAQIDNTSGTVRISSPIHGDPLQPWATIFDERVLESDGGTITALAFGCLHDSSAPDDALTDRKALVIGTSLGAILLHVLASGKSGAARCLLETVEGSVRQIRITTVKSVRPIDQEQCLVCGSAVDGSGAVLAYASKTQLHAVRLAFAHRGGPEGHCACAPGWVGPARSRTSFEETYPDDPSQQDRAMQGLRTPRRTRGADRLSSEAQRNQAGSVDLASAGENPGSLLTQIQLRELLRTTIDERGGWELLEGVLLGLHRVRNAGTEHLGNPSSEWQAWSARTRVKSCIVGRTSLDTLLTTAEVRDLRRPEHGDDDSQASTMSTLRRRRLLTGRSGTNTKSNDYSSASAGPTRLKTTIDLPFTRARSVIAALGGTALAVGLGNQVVLLSPALQDRIELSWTLNGPGGLRSLNGRMKHQ